MKKQKQVADSTNIVGKLRLNIVDFADGKPRVVGDSGWVKNKITNLGAQHFLVEALGVGAGSSQLAYVALGTGSTVLAADTLLLGELTDAAGCRFTFNTSVVASRTLQMVGTLNSGIITANRTLDDIGLFAVSTTSAGSIFAGTTYATSQLQTNQAVNVDSLRRRLVIIGQKLREFGGTLFETIPSRVVRRGVQTMHEATHWVEDIVGTVWQHTELGRNDLILAIG